MAYEFLKKLFGTPKEGEEPKALTFSQLVAAIEADKSLKLVDLSAGEYVSKHKYDDKETELNGIRQQLDDANKQIKAFGGMSAEDVKNIQQKAQEWETKYNSDTQSLKDQMEAQARNHAEEMFMSGYKFTSKAARNGILAEFRGKKFTLKDGVFEGGKDFMADLMKNEEYAGAFVTENTGDNGSNNAGAAGAERQRNPRFAGGSNGGNSGGSTNPFNLCLTHVREPKKD